MESAKVPEAFRLDQGARGQRAYAPYLEERAKHQKGTIKDQSLQALRPPRRGERRLVGQNDTVSYLGLPSSQALRREGRLRFTRRESYFFAAAFGWAISQSMTSLLAWSVKLGTCPPPSMVHSSKPSP